MKIKFQIKKQIISQRKDTHERILAFLNDSDYRIVQNTQQNISFDDEKESQWKFKSNLRYYKLTDGKFDFTVNESANILSLRYNMDISFEMLFFTISLFCGIYVDHIYLFASLFIISSLLVKFYFLRSEGGDMMNNILG